MGHQGKILLVDDEPLVRGELGGLLEDEGYEVLCAADGEQGLEVFKREQPDMVITNVRMPRTDGVSLAVAIRELSPSTPVTVITGHGNEQMAVFALRAGVTDFIQKPVRYDDLSAALTRMQSAREVAGRDYAERPPDAPREEQVWRYGLRNDFDAIPSLVEAVLEGCGAGAPSAALMELSLALRELILNAIEHGNLGISYEQKARALEEGTLSEVLKERGAQAPYAGRHVEIVARRRANEIVVEIGDEGAGFDWRRLPDPTDPDHILESHGRGVLLARMSVDRLAYNDDGNRVTVHKKLNPKPPS